MGPSGFRRPSGDWGFGWLLALFKLNLLVGKILDLLLRVFQDPGLLLRNLNKVTIMGIYGK